MSERIRSFDWSVTSLGASENWPVRLKAVIELMLATPLPMTLHCGRLERTMLYNDAAIAALGPAHPDALGASSPKTFATAGSAITSLYDRAFLGETIIAEAQSVSIGSPQHSQGLDFYLIPLRDETGEVAYVQTIGVDATARLFPAKARDQTISVLHKKEERLEALVRASCEIYFVMSADWKKMKMPSGSGFLVDSLKPGSERLCQYIHPDDQNHVLTAIERALQTKSAFQAEYRVVRSDATSGWAYSKAIPRFSQNGSIVEWLGVARDITERKRAEEALHESEERQVYLLKLSDALRSLSDPVAIQAEAARLLGEHLGSDRAYYVEVDENTGEYVAARNRDQLGENSHPSPYPPETWPMPWLANGQTWVVRDTATDPILPDEQRKSYIGNGIGALIVVPLIKGGRLVATFLTSQQMPRDWTAKDIRLVEETGERTWAVVERARAEEALRESEERFRQFSEASSDVLWMRDAKTLQWEYLSPIFESIYGLKVADALRGNNFKGWAELILPEDRKRALGNIDKVRKGKRATFEYRVKRTVDGKIRWLRNSDFPIFGPDGQVTRIGGIGQDITNLKNAEAALRESEKRLRQFAEYSAHTLWILDLETQVLTRFGSAFEQTWGAAARPPETQAEWVRAIHPEDQERILHALNEVKLGEVMVEEYRIIRPDNTIRWVRDTLFPILNEEKLTNRIGGIMQDITQNTGSFVYVIDGNTESSESLVVALREAGYNVRAFGSIKSFLAVAPALAPGCVVCDIRDPSMSGLSFLREVKSQRVDLPVIIIGNPHGDVMYGVKALKAGAVDFMPAPYRRKDVLMAVASVSSQVQVRETKDHETELANARIEALPDRELEVLERLLAGGSNKSIALDMGLSPRTVEVYRARVMQRLDAQTLSELVLMAAKAGLKPKAPKT